MPLARIIWKWKNLWKGEGGKGKEWLYFKKISSFIKLFQKQLFRGVLKKRCSENMQQIYRRTPMLKCDFNKVAKQLKMKKKKLVDKWRGFEGFLRWNRSLEIKIYKLKSNRKWEYRILSCIPFVLIIKTFIMLIPRRYQ